jgi:hypothetical protein
MSDKPHTTTAEREVERIVNVLWESLKAKCCPDPEARRIVLLEESVFKMVATEALLHDV